MAVIWLNVLAYSCNRVRDTHRMYSAGPRVSEHLLEEDSARAGQRAGVAGCRRPPPSKFLTFSSLPASRLLTQTA